MVVEAYMVMLPLFWVEKFCGGSGDVLTGQEGKMAMLDICGS